MCAFVSVFVVCVRGYITVRDYHPDKYDLEYTETTPIPESERQALYPDVVAGSLYHKIWHCRFYLYRLLLCRMMLCRSY